MKYHVNRKLDWVDILAQHNKLIDVYSKIPSFIETERTALRTAFH